MTRPLFCDGRPLGQILTAGWPDWIGTDGTTLGWAVRDRLFLTSVADDAAVVRIVELPDAVEGVHTDATGWVVALGQGFVVVDPGTGRVERVVLDDEADPVGTRGGREVGVYVEAPAHRVIDLVTGDELAIPDGARHSRWLTPWASGRGVAWVDADIVYRLGFLEDGPKISAVGRCRGVKELCAGPEGALVVRGRTASLLVAARGFGVDGPLLDAVRFVEAETVLATDAERAFELRLADGGMGREWRGHVDPVGGGGGDRLVHDRAVGEVRNLTGTQRWSGFCGAHPARDGARLAGPGGRVWTLPADIRGDVGAEDVALVDGLLGVGGDVLVHADEGVRVLVAEGDSWRERAQLADGAGVDGVAVRDGVIVVERGDSVERYGPPLWLRLPDEESVGVNAEAADPNSDGGVRISEEGADSNVCRGRQRWPVPADHARAATGGVYAWSDHGALYALTDLRATPAPKLRRG